MKPKDRIKLLKQQRDAALARVAELEKKSAAPVKKTTQTAGAKKK